MYTVERCVILTEAVKFRREHFSDEIYVVFDADEMNKEDIEWS